MTRPPAPAPDAPARRTLAASPDTAPARLAQLAADANLHIRLAAAANPATPRETLRDLQRLGCTANLAAPAPPDPALDADTITRLVALGEWPRRLAASHPGTPPEVLTSLSRDPSAATRRAVAAHPNTPAAALARLLADADERVRRRANQHPQAPRDVIDHLHAISHLKSHISNLQSQNSHLTSPIPNPKSLAALGPHAAGLVAAHPDTPTELLTSLSHDPTAAVRRALLTNPATPAAVLEALADDAPAAARAALAAHPHASPPLLARLARDDDFRVRAAVAAHPHTPPATLADLLADDTGLVRAAASAHPQAPRDVIDQLHAISHLKSQNSHLKSQISDLRSFAARGPFARALLARHPDTPADVLDNLACDADPLIREAVAAHPTRPPILDDLIRLGSSADLQGYADPQQIAPAVCAALAARGPWPARLAARHPDADATLLAALATHAHGPVRAAVARHLRTDDATLEALARDALPDVRWALTRRATLPPAVTQTLARDPLPTLRAALAAHPSTAPDVRDQLTRDLDEDVRAAARERT